MDSNPSQHLVWSVFRILVLLTEDFILLFLSFQDTLCGSSFRTYFLLVYLLWWHFDVFNLIWFPIVQYWLSVYVQCQFFIRWLFLKHSPSICNFLKIIIHLLVPHSKSLEAQSSPTCQFSLPWLSYLLIYYCEKTPYPRQLLKESI